MTTLSQKPAAKKLAALLNQKIPPQKASPTLRHAASQNHIPTPKAFAKATGLHYISDTSPGIHRLGSASSFRYLSASGNPLHDPATLRRIRSLAIPPAWKNVWISPRPEGHIQATGTDARGRKQYRYHPLWRSTRDETKFHRLIAFGKALPKIRCATARHLKQKGLPREKVLAAIVQLLEKTSIRVGNDEYAKNNHSFGLTTIHNRHAHVTGNRVHFEFRGKSGVDQQVDLASPVLAKIVRQCQDLPGQELFGYRNADGKTTDITSSDVNDYLRQITGEEFTAKDFRTWNGTVLAAKALHEISTFTSPTQARKNVLKAVEKVARRLGNTRSVCRKCYVHPAVIDAYLDGSLIEILSRQARRQMRCIARLDPLEAAVLAFLQERLSRERSRVS